MKAAHHAAKGHAKKHAHANKHVHHHHAKHHPHHQKKPHHALHRAKVHTVGHHQKHAKGLALAPGDVACCVSEALAASLRHLQPPGLSITGADVLALHRAAGADDETGGPILAVLEAASETGLGGLRLGAFDLADLSAVTAGAFGVGPAFAMDAMEDRVAVGPRPGNVGHSLILGLDLPGQHTVLATAEGWWSWGGLWCPCEFPDAVIDEAWAVSWA